MLVIVYGTLGVGFRKVSLEMSHLLGMKESGFVSLSSGLKLFPTPVRVICMCVHVYVRVCPWCVCVCVCRHWSVFVYSFINL